MVHTERSSPTGSTSSRFTNHMTGVAPVVIFLHYYGTGPAARLAQGVRAATDLLGKTVSR